VDPGFQQSLHCDIHYTFSFGFTVSLTQFPLKTGGTPVITADALPALSSHKINISSQSFIQPERLFKRAYNINNIYLPPEFQQSLSSH